MLNMGLGLLYTGKADFISVGSIHYSSYSQVCTTGLEVDPLDNCLLSDGLNDC